MLTSLPLTYPRLSSKVDWTTSFYANRVKFAILTTMQLLAIPCFLWIFYQFGRQRQLRQSHHHHVIILLLIISFIFVTVALPLTQVYMYTSHVFPESDAFCSFWNWFTYSLNIINLFLMAFASIERHWLIFHPWLVRPMLGKILLHYCPLAFCLLYPPLFYMGMIFIYKCEAYYDYTQLLCTYPCYFYNVNYANVDLFLNNYTPLLAIPVFCGCIYGRVFMQKRALKREAFKWSRDKKMILQLWAISSLYLGMWMPLQLASLINLYWDPLFLFQAQVDYIYLFPYLIHLLYPFVVLATYRNEMLNLRGNAVRPQITQTARRNMTTYNL